MNWSSVGWLTRLRGAVGMGLTWAVGWAVTGLLIGVAIEFVGLPMGWFTRVFDAPLPALAIPGFVSGAAFSTVLGIAGRRRRFDELSLPRFALWGGSGGLAVSLVPLAIAGPGVGAGAVAVVVGTLTGLSAASAAGTLALARMSGGEEVRELPARAFWMDMARLQVGLFLFGLAVSLMLEARIGLDPWSSFHDVVATWSGLSFGRISQMVGLTLIVISRIALDVRPGIATVFNMLVIGPWVDALRPHVRFFEAGAIGPGTVQFLAGILVMGLGTAVYIGARLGAGPRDGLAMGLSRRIGRSLRASRIGIEVTVLVVAAVLGGSIGIGTLLFAVLMGPTMQTSLRLFAVPHDPSPRIRREGITPPHAGGVG